MVWVRLLLVQRRPLHHNAVCSAFEMHCSTGNSVNASAVAEKNEGRRLDSPLKWFEGHVSWDSPNVGPIFQFSFRVFRVRSKTRCGLLGALLDNGMCVQCIAETMRMM